MSRFCFVAALVLALGIVAIAEREPVVFSLHGVVPNYPTSVNVYLDYARLDTATLQIFVVDVESKAFGLCRKNLAYDAAEFNFRECALSAGVVSSASESSTIVMVATARERADGTWFRAEATMEVLVPPKYPWPVENVPGVWPPSPPLPNVAANIMEDYQSFTATPYWHRGLDIRSNLEDDGLAGKVFSPCDGEVVQVIKYSSSDLYWSVMVRDAFGYIFQIHHMDVNSITVSVGDVVTQGTVLGRIAYWPSSTNGELYHHIHLNVVRPHPSWDSIPEPYIDGWLYYNPIEFFDSGDFTNEGLIPTSDGIFYYLPNESDVAFAAQGEKDPAAVVFGDIDIVVSLEHLFVPTNDIQGHPYVLGVYEVELDIAAVDDECDTGSSHMVVVRSDKVPGDTWFECLPDNGDACSDRMLLNVFRREFTYEGTKYKTVFNYSERVNYYTVTNVARGEPSGKDGSWNTAELLPNGERRYPDGMYDVTVRASDIWGNQLTLTRQVMVDNSMNAS